MGSIDLETAPMYSDEEDDLPPIPQDMPPLSPTRRGDEPGENAAAETGKMGSIDLETDPMYSDDEDNLPPIPQDMPPLSPTRRGDDHGENGAAETGPFDDIPTGEGEAENEGTGRPKRMIRRNPQPKLDHVRLTSDRGLPTILKHFENIKWKGKGHEVSDLNTLMMTMEHWGNRLFPKMTFDEVIERVEKLGKKKPVQVCLTKIRMDMPLLDEDFVQREEEDDVIRGEETTEGDEPLPDLPNATTTPGNVSYGTLDITDDQKKRMEENKRKAMERRAARMQASQNTTGITADELADITQSGSANEKIDSDEEDLENEMWNDLISTQQTSTQRPKKSNDNNSKIIAIDSDDEELEREAWNEISKSQVKKPVAHCPEYDDETDDDDDYEEYFTKLKGLTLSSDGATDSGVKDKTDSSSELNENDEQSLSMLNEDAPAGNATTVTGGDEKEEEEQSQSILGEDAAVVSSSTKDKASNHVNQKSASDKNNSQNGEAEKTDDVDDEATCLPDDETQMGDGDPQDEEAICLPDDDTQVPEAGPSLQDDDATCLPQEDNIADLETQLLEEDTAAMETQAMVPDGDTAVADTVAMATQEVKESGHVDTAEADTMEFEAMDTAEAETQAVK